MVTKQKILIVDDDENIAELISLYLLKECFDTMMVHDGEEALAAFDSYSPNLVLLDLMLPGIDGYQVCREIRAKSDTPIIMLSAKGEVFDKVLGLELGADDYMIKPFDSKELVARVKAVLRRYQAPRQETAAAEKGKCVSYPGIEINLTNYSVVCDGKESNASKGTGTALFPRILTKSSIYKRTAPRPNLGLRIHRRYKNCRCAYQASARKNQGPSDMESRHRVGYRIQV